ncbi:response regulator [Maricaulis maris]|uniref:Two-component system chemotaxis response regulator CheY n=1 Tax=Maricaulis maris TaxID=74318 RepID=A0A495DDK4_9PROT|nr:response regulator [Maricaulis maris]RKR00382.1 two-component system chemotaxis response regulator CheY [Maricaulis maris]
MSALSVPIPDRLTVLLVDDSRPVRAVIRTLLTGIGFARVFEAADGDEALVLTRTCRPDLALIDYDLGLSSGLDLAQRLRDPRQCDRPDLPLFLLAADGFAHLVRGAAAAGVSAVLPKPVNPQTLLTALATKLAAQSPLPGGADMLASTAGGH